MATGMPDGLAHDELGRAGQLVDHRDLGDLELAARGRRSCPAGRRPRRCPAQPMATSVRPRRHVRPKVSDTMTRDLDAGPGPDAVADAAGRAVGVDRQEGGPALVDVRQVDAGVGAHEAVARSR